MPTEDSTSPSLLPLPKERSPPQNYVSNNTSASISASKFVQNSAERFSVEDSDKFASQDNKTLGENEIGRATPHDKDKNSKEFIHYMNNGTIMAHGDAAGVGADNDFKNLFLNHDNWLRTVSAKQAQTFENLEGSLGTLESNVETMQERSSEMISQLSKLDEMIDGERAKWTQLLQEEEYNIGVRENKLQDSSDRVTSGYDIQKRKINF